MPKLTFKTDNCKGCGLCVDACPKGVLAIAKEKINKKGHHPVEAVKEEEKSEPKQLIVKEKAELIKKEVMDVSFLLGEKKPVKPLEKEEKQPEKSEKKPDVKQEEKPTEYETGCSSSGRRHWSSGK